jgi:hypothetical protein
LASSLYGEVLLSLGDFWFSGIAILCDEVTGEARKMIILNFSFGLTSDADHFTGAGKMVIGLFPDCLQDSIAFLIVSSNRCHFV